MNKKIIGCLGKKKGMTQIVSSVNKIPGILVPVTIIEVTDNVITQVKTLEKDGYIASQVAFQDCKESRVNKPILGHLKKTNVIKKHIKEIRGMDGFNLSDNITLNDFAINTKITIVSRSKGKGTAGVIKKYHFSRGRMSHGGGYPHRLIGSMGGGRGSNQGIPKGKKMPGRMGNNQITYSTIIEGIDLDNKLLLVRGGVPGSNGSIVKIIYKENLK